MEEFVYISTIAVKNDFDELKKRRYINDLLEEIDSLWLWHRQLYKADDGFTRAKETDLNCRIEKLEKQYKDLTGSEYAHFNLRK